MTTTTQFVNIKRSFIYQTLTKIIENGVKLDYSSIEKFQKELVFNAVSIQSTFRDNINCNFFVLSATEYTVATIFTTQSVGVPIQVAPIIPVQPLSLTQRSIKAPTVNNRYEVIDEFRNYEITKSNYFLYHHIFKLLVKKIVTTVPQLYIDELAHPYIKFCNATPSGILAHLVLNYGTIIALDTDTNVVRINYLGHHRNLSSPCSSSYTTRNNLPKMLV